MVKVAKTKKLLTILCALGLLAGAGAYTASTSPWGSPGQRTHTEYGEMLLGCSKGVYTLEILRSDEVQTCMLNTMKEAGDARQAKDLDMAIGYVIRRQPTFFDVCHDLGHAAGRYAYTKHQDIADLVAGIGTSCQYALGHGVLDGFADTKPDETAYRQAVAACESIGDPLTVGYCADGLGHVAWSSTEDLAGAARRCAYLGKEGLEQACAEGILMQIYEPAGFEPWRDIADAPAEIPAMCANWPQADRAANLAGCHSGAGYIFSRNLAKNSAAWEIRGEMTERLYADVLESIRYALNGCALMNDKVAVDMCHQSLSQQYPKVVHYDERLEDAACEPLGRWAERCRTWRTPAK